MESANHAKQDKASWEGIRIAQQEDAGAIIQLLRDGDFAHIHADWHYPADWLGLNTFAVLRRLTSRAANHSITERFFGTQSQLEACLAVAADPLPAAWVRLAAVTDRSAGAEQLSHLFTFIQDSLREGSINQVAWLLLEAWPESWLPDLGFERTNEVITLVKDGTALPADAAIPECDIRPVRSADLPALAAIESRSFEPLWQHSAHGLALARQQALSFDVAWHDSRPVGFQFSTAALRGAHLSRITVDASIQQSGIGTALLAHALEGFRHRGIRTVTLNTQADNIPSQKLYDRFGFVRSGERFPIWSVNL
jgi:ribosomal protein S18 acetylase RimI-like enzyme